MNNISRNNHFVAQMYLEAWKNSNNKVWTYDLLVPKRIVTYGVKKVQNQ